MKGRERVTEAATSCFVISKALATPWYVIRGIAVVAVVAAVCASLSRPASASGRELTEEELCTTAKWAFTAEVIRKTPFRPKGRFAAMHIMTELELRTKAILTGEVPDRLVATVSGGTIGEETWISSFAPPFEFRVGRQYLFFAAPVPDSSRRKETGDILMYLTVPIPDNHDFNFNSEVGHQIWREHCAQSFPDEVPFKPTVPFLPILPPEFYDRCEHY